MDRLVETAQKEWEKIRSSLKLCGEVGEFTGQLIREGSGLGEEEYSDFLESLGDFKDTFEEHGYDTIESMGVFTILVRFAAERLGLRDILAKAFANGYTFIRTGWALDTDTSIEQNLFYKMFFRSREDYGWEFDSAEVQERFKLIFDKFLSWEQDRAYYAMETGEYLEMKQEEAEEAD